MGMIDVDLFRKKGTSSGGNVTNVYGVSGGSTGTVSEAEHASRSDEATHASRADSASRADDATHAANADNAVNADNAAEAAHATNADKATNADEAAHAASAANLDDDSSAWEKIKSWIMGLKDRYLSKVDDDTAAGVITFLKDIIVRGWGIFTKGWRTQSYDGDDSMNGHGGRVDENGNAVFQSIFARGFISAPKFVFNEVYVTKSEQWNTNAYGTIESVDTENRQITLHLEDNEYGSVVVGDICRGIFADIGNTHGSDNNVEGDADACNFIVHKGFFTTYFCVEKIITNEKGKCVFQYRKRTSSTPDPCAYMDFAQYGSFTDSSRRSSVYMSSRGRSYIEVLDGVDNWEIQPENRVCRYGWLGNLTIQHDDGTTEQLEGNGLFAQNHVYFGGDIIRLSNISDLDDLQRMAGAYDVSLSRYQGVITVDDMGNVIGGLYTLSDMPQDDGTARQVKQWRLSTAVYVRKGQDILIEEDSANEIVREGHYRVTAFGDGCECEIANSTVYITSIRNLRDGIAETEDEIDYDEMRKMERCRVTIVVELEGKTTKTVEFPVRIAHDSLPFLECDLDNEHSSVSWNTKAGKYSGLPVETVATLMYHNEPWQIDKDSHVDGLPSGLKATVTFPASAEDKGKMKVSITADGTKAGDFLAKADGEATVTKHDVSIHIIGTYAGARYEYSKTLTIDRRADTTVYEIVPSADSIVVDRSGNLTANSLTCEVWATSSDDKRYKVNDLKGAGLTLKYCKGAGTPDTTFGTSVSVAKSDKCLTIGLYGNKGETLDMETVPVVAWGEDGKGVEFIYFRSKDAQTVLDNYKPDEWFADAKYQGGSEAEYISEIQKKYPGWTDDPQGVDTAHPYEYVSVRRSVNGVWGKFSQPAVYATMARGIKGVNTYYALAGEGATPKEAAFIYDELTDVVIAANEGRMVWSADRVTYYDGDTALLNKTCLGACKELASVTEQYGVSADMSTAPSSPYDASGAYPRDLGEGDCIWSRDHIVWLKGNATDTDWQFIGRIGKDGIKGDKGDDAVMYDIVCSDMSPNVTGANKSVTFTAYTIIGKDRALLSMSKEGMHWQWKYNAVQNTSTSNSITLTVSADNTAPLAMQLVDGSNTVYRECTVSPVVNGDPGDPGTPATYYEARFTVLSAGVYVDQGYESGYVSAVAKGSFYLVEGDKATKAGHSGLGLQLDFLNDAGTVIITKTATVTNETFSYASTSKSEIQAGYRDRGSNKITQLRYTVTNHDGRDTKGGIIPVSFNAGSVFYHTDKRFESLIASRDGKYSELTQTVDGISAKVGSMAGETKNILVMGSIGELKIKGAHYWYTNYEGTVALSAGKTYTLTWKGRMQDGSKYGKMNVYSDNNAEYHNSYGSDGNEVLCSGTVAKVYSYKFTVAKSGKYSLAYYISNADGSTPNSLSGLTDAIILDWVRLDEGDQTAFPPQEWTPSDADTEAVNLLPDHLLESDITGTYTDAGLGTRNVVRDQTGTSINSVMSLGTDADGVAYVEFNRTTSPSTDIADGLRWYIPFRGAGDYSLSASMKCMGSGASGNNLIMELHPCDAGKNRIRNGVSAWMSLSDGNNFTGWKHVKNTVNINATETSTGISSAHIKGDSYEVVWLEVRLFMTRYGDMAASRLCVSKCGHATLWNAQEESAERKAEADSLATGIDIYRRGIVLTSDNTIFRTNSGKNIAVFSKDGLNTELLETGNLIISGNVQNVVRYVEDGTTCQVVDPEEAGFWRFATSNSNGSDYGYDKCVNEKVAVLPMFNAYNPTGGTVRTTAYRRGGIRLLIQNEYNASAENWHIMDKMMKASYDQAINSHNGSADSTACTALAGIHRSAMVVCADPRLLDTGNYSNGSMKVSLSGSTTNDEHGMMVCNGRKGKMLVLMPGETVELQSYIKDGVLYWVVMNGAEFEAIAKRMVMSYNGNTIDTNFSWYKNTGSGNFWGEVGKLYLFGNPAIDAKASDVMDGVTTRTAYSSHFHPDIDINVTATAVTMEITSQYVANGL